ncbi:hypothetical protein [Chromobacterium haemolyticum]|uniref:hypothetical protein n=1 Tax=Chromobacterium haemolyticum TaxID=394935 RepID=UPI0024498E55|nr:hypothetical protein [Chromobacterium haemolyticum]MDH0341986.1 hypothetical protein [Chromobacterium haemolyticum]
MDKGLFQSWLEIEKAAGKSMGQILTEVNSACGTAYRHNWPTKMAESGYSLERVPLEVRRYMLRKVLPAELAARGVVFPPDVLEVLIKRLT